MARVNFDRYRNSVSSPSACWYMIKTYAHCLYTRSILVLSECGLLREQLVESDDQPNLGLLGCHMLSGLFSPLFFLWPCVVGLCWLVP
jgi:hypothetical protein